MPYRKAWLWVLLLFALTFVAFWPGYFSKLPDKNVATIIMRPAQSCG